MEKKTYSEKLRDPRWQKKRLEVMQRDDFSCAHCHSDSETLNVHHCYYDGYNDPWDYPFASLITLCEECHEQESKNKNWEFEGIKRLKAIGFTSNNFEDLLVAFEKMNKLPFAYEWSAITHMINDYDLTTIVHDLYMIKCKNESEAANG